MKCTVILILATFLIGISPSKATVEQESRLETTIEQEEKSEAPKEGNSRSETTMAQEKRSEAIVEQENKNTAPTGTENTKTLATQNSEAIGGKNTFAPDQSKNVHIDASTLEQLKNKAAAINPMNLISAVMMEDENTLLRATRLLRRLKNGILENALLRTFIDNLIDLMENIYSDSLDSMLDRFPNFLRVLKQTGKYLTSVAKFKKDQRAIFDAQVFDPITNYRFGELVDDSTISEYDGEDEKPSIPQYTLHDSVTGTPFVITMSRGGYN